MTTGEDTVLRSPFERGNRPISELGDRRYRIGQKFDERLSLRTSAKYACQGDNAAIMHEKWPNVWVSVEKSSQKSQKRRFS